MQLLGNYSSEEDDSGGEEEEEEEVEDVVMADVSTSALLSTSGAGEALVRGKRRRAGVVIEDGSDSEEEGKRLRKTQRVVQEEKTREEDEDEEEEEAVLGPTRPSEAERAAAYASLAEVRVDEEEQRGEAGRGPVLYDTAAFVELGLVPPEPFHVRVDAALQARIDGFLARGPGFLDMLESSKAFNNPALLETLTESLGIHQYGTNLPPDVYNPGVFGEADRYMNVRAAQDVAIQQRANARAQQDVTVAPGRQMRERFREEVAAVRDSAAGAAGAAAGKRRKRKSRWGKAKKQ